MTKTFTIVCLLLAASAAFSQQSKPCYESLAFSNEDRITLESSTIADHVVLMNILRDVLLSSFAPDVKEDMMACARQRNEEAAKASNPAPAEQPAPAVPQTFAPSVKQEPMPFVPATAPTVRPMTNYAPSQMIQNGQTMMDSGLQMMMMANLMPPTTQDFTKPKKVSDISFRISQSRQTVFDETLQILSSEKYNRIVNDWPSGKIQAIGMTIDGSQVAVVVSIRIVSTESGAFLRAVFAKYPGVIFGRSPKTLAANFEKDLRKVQPDLVAEQ